MSSDTQFTANGPTSIGFQTYGTNIDRGVDVGGNTHGVIGTCVGKLGDGVRGFGSGFYSGVAGFGASGVQPGTGVVGFGGEITSGETGGGACGVRGIGGGGPNITPQFADTAYLAGIDYPGSGTAVGVYGHGGPISDGVRGESDQAAGVRGIATGGAGVLGFGYGGIGVLGTVRGKGIAGQFEAPRGGTAGLFFGSVYVFGDLLASGAKSAAVPFPDGSHRRLYCMESPESWFEDFGEGLLINGHAAIEFDPHFMSVADLEKYHVFLSEYGGNNALFVTDRTKTGFSVRTNTLTAVNSEFSYRIVAKRKDISPCRFEKVEMHTRRMGDGLDQTDVPS